MLSLSSYSNIEIIPREIRDYLSKFSYVFNPSVSRDVLGTYMAIRVFSDQVNRIEAYLFFWDDDGMYEKINLTRFFKEETPFSVVADPKLFLLDDNKVYGTFNTGFVEEGNNSVVFFEFRKTEILNYYECFYKDRQRIEKNWSFYTEGRELFALYSISPTVILKCKKETGRIECKTEWKEVENISNYSIGTPLVKVNTSEYLFIGHKKIHRKGKRIYLGVPLVFNSDTKKIERERPIIIHSLMSLLGNKHKFNKNLISCTYFSGLMKQDDEVYIAYGINDVSWNIIKIKQTKIWNH